MSSRSVAGPCFPPSSRWESSSRRRTRCGARSSRNITPCRSRICTCPSVDPACSVESVLRGRDDQHRTGCDLEETVRNAAQQQALERPAAHAAEDDQVGGGGCGGVSDGVSRAARSDLEDLELNVEAFGLGLGNLVLDLRLQLRLQCLSMVCTTVAGVELVNVRDAEPCLLVGGELLAEGNRAISGIRSVSRDDDDLEHVSNPPDEVLPAACTEYTRVRHYRNQVGSPRPGLVARSRLRQNDLRAVCNA